VSDPLTTPGPTEEDRAGLDQYRRWARFLFTILALLAAIGLILVPANAGLDPQRIAGLWPIVVILTANVAATLLVLLGLIRGLTKESAWALHAVLPVCVVLIVIGAARTVIALTQNQILLPLEAIGGLLVLSRPHGPDLLPPASSDDRRRATIAAGVMFASYFVPLVLPLALT
jgi:lysylphosphatidylglycerol synthetase-like protein (DUF2156 family)